MRGCGCGGTELVEKVELAREFEEFCASLPRSTVARLSVPPVGVGKGRPRVGEGGFEVGCVACVGKGLLGPEDGLSADWLTKGKTGVFALAPGDG